MKYLYLSILLICIGCSLAFLSPETADSLRAFKKERDTYIYQHLKDFRYYAKTKQSEKPYQVTTGQWPSDMQWAYSVLPDAKGNIIFAQTEQNGEWGDYTIDYRYYFDASGHTVSFVRYARFYHSVCVNNDAVDEIRTFYYTPDFKELGKDFEFHSEEGKKLDSLKCDFPYNFPYKIYSTWEELRKDSQLP